VIRVGDTTFSTLSPRASLTVEQRSFVLRNLLLALLLLFSVSSSSRPSFDTQMALAIEFLELCDGVFVDGIDEKQDFEALLLEDLEEGESRTATSDSPVR